MKTLKLLSLAAVTTMALMAFAASSASATELYNGATTLGAGATIDFSLKPGTSIVLTDTENEPLNSCAAFTIQASITAAGGATATTVAAISNLSLGSCTWSATPTILGKMEFHQIGSGTNATVTAGADLSWSFTIPFFGSCTYSVPAGFELGTLTTASSGSATFHFNTVPKKGSGSSITCPETAKWTGTFISTEPLNLRVESS